MCQNIPSFFPSGAIRRKNIKVFVIFLILFVLAFVLTTFNLTQHSNHSLSRTNSIGIPNKFLYFKNFISAKNTSQVRKDEKWRQVRILCFVITYPKNLGKIKNELFTLLLEKNPPLEEYLVRSGELICRCHKKKRKKIMMFAKYQRPSSTLELQKNCSKKLCKTRMGGT